MVRRTEDAAERTSGYWKGGGGDGCPRQALQDRDTSHTESGQNHAHAEVIDFPSDETPTLARHFPDSSVHSKCATGVQQPPLESNANEIIAAWSDLPESVRAALGRWQDLPEPIRKAIEALLNESG